MGVFNNAKTIELTGPANMTAVIEDVTAHFTARGFEVNAEQLGSGGAYVSMTSKNMFKAALGMKTALNVEIDPQIKGWAIKTAVGIFGQQVVPTIITLFFAWPVLLTQMWGLVKQSKLDDEAIAVIEASLKSHTIEPDSTSLHGQAFCTHCGTLLNEEARFCMQCGCKLVTAG